MPPAKQLALLHRARVMSVRRQTTVVVLARAGRGRSLKYEVRPAYQLRLLGVNWQELGRVLAPREVVQRDIRQAFRDDARKRAAPWEGRGRQE